MDLDGAATDRLGSRALRTAAPTKRLTIFDTIARYRTRHERTEVTELARQAVADKRQRRERGSISVDEIINGAFEVAEEVSVDGLSMPLLAKHLDVGVTSIYWYFRKKDDLLNAMTDRALGQYDFATPFVEGQDWQDSLRDHARKMRQTFRDNPILCDLFLIRRPLRAGA